jgi:hypothetical protein
VVQFGVPCPLLATTSYPVFVEAKAMYPPGFTAFEALE